MTERQIDLITITDPKSPISEAFRTLRTNLQFASVDSDLKTMLVTSPVPDSTASSALANLAVTMAQAENKIILVDCDLRRPTMHEIFGVENDAGLVTMMVDDRAFENPPLHETDVPGLWFLPSGPQPPRPSDLLGSKRMEVVIAKLLEQADIVLFNAPPILGVTDASILATKVDGVLMVINANHTRREEVQNAKAQMEKVNAHIVGTVLGNVPMDRQRRSYY